MKRKDSRSIQLTDTIGRTVTIKKVGAGTWELRQRFLGKSSDNAQNPTWVRIDNPGTKRKIEIALFWANIEWPHWRLFGYQKIGDEYTAVRGETDPQSTRYRFEVPKGTSWFGAFPWYTNEDAEAFMQRMAADPLCRTRVIGNSGRGRPIKCLTIGQAKRGRRNVVVLARTHATETPGSFAVEGIAGFLLNSRMGRRLVNKHVFHLFPNVNPDGVAAGLKLTRRGARAKYDMAAAMTSADATIAALRREILRLRPACLIDYHSYLFRVPGIFFLDDKLGLAVLRELLHGRKDEAGFYFRAMLPDDKMHASTLWSHCFLRYQATVAVVELSWNLALLPDDVRRMGVDVFRAVMKSHRPNKWRL